jgi:hypothetical protein
MRLFETNSFERNVQVRVIDSFRCRDVKREVGSDLSRDSWGLDLGTVRTWAQVGPVVIDGLGNSLSDRNAPGSYTPSPFV